MAKDEVQPGRKKAPATKATAKPKDEPKAKEAAAPPPRKEPAPSRPDPSPSKEEQEAIKANQLRKEALTKMPGPYAGPRNRPEPEPVEPVRDKTPEEIQEKADRGLVRYPTHK